MEYASTVYRKVFLLILAPLLIALFACNGGVTGPELYNAELDFYQVDFEVEGEITTNSAWGSVDLTHDCSADILYFNLAVNGRWVIQNIPVLSFDNPGVRQTLPFDFNLGVDDGTDVTQLEYAFDLTTGLIEDAPADYRITEVFDREVIRYSGADGSELPSMAYTQDDDDPPGDFEGGAVLDHARLLYNWPFNQENTARKEMGPTAVSNSLMWLNFQFNLQLPPGKINIEAAKGYTGFKQTGKFWITSHGENNEEPPWYFVKAIALAYEEIRVETNSYNDLNGRAKRIEAFDKVIRAIDDNKDVELTIITGSNNGKPISITAMVVGISKYQVGGVGRYKYELALAVDNRPGQKGGTGILHVYYDPGTDTIEGGGRGVNGGRLYVDDPVYKDSFAPIVIEEPDTDTVVGR